MKFVGTIVIGVVELSRGISKNGVTNMECAVLVFQTQRTSMKLLLFRYDSIYYQLTGDIVVKLDKWH